MNSDYSTETHIDENGMVEDIYGNCRPTKQQTNPLSEPPTTFPQPSTTDV